MQRIPVPRATHRCHPPSCPRYRATAAMKIIGDPMMPTSRSRQQMSKATLASQRWLVSPSQVCRSIRR